MLFLWVVRKGERWVSGNKWEWGRSAKKQNEIPLNCLRNLLTHIHTCIYIHIDSHTHTTQVKLWKAKFTVRIFQWHFLPPMFLSNSVRPVELHKSFLVCVFCWGHSEDRGILGAYFYMVVKLIWAQSVPSPISLSHLSSQKLLQLFSHYSWWIFTSNVELWRKYEKPERKSHAMCCFLPSLFTPTPL